MRQLNPTNKNDQYLALIVGQMALEGVPESTIQFFMNIYHKIVSPNAYLKRREMAELAYMSTQAAGNHIKRLIAGKYLDRHNRIAWRLSDTPITSPVYISLSRFVNGAA